MKHLIKKLLREGLLNEIRVINPDIMSLQNEEPLKDSDTIRVYHGFNNYEDAIIAIKFGFSGKEKAKRIYSYESNNNPNGVFITLDLETAKKFTYPRSKRGIVVILELSVKVSDLEAPVWPGGSYTVQGQMAQFWKDKDDRYEKGTLKAREDASDDENNFISGSDRPEVAASLAGSERQALFIGDINPNMVKSIYFGESGKHGYSPKRLDRISRKEFLNKFETHEPEDDAYGRTSNKGYEYHDKKSKIFNPNDDLSIEVLDSDAKKRGYESGEQYLRAIIDNDYLEGYLWPKQISQVDDFLKTIDTDETLN
tara:strand:+ start:36 stop:968 length:933 start_codon:yes stop_codon:yes gene_type:complete